MTLLFLVAETKKQAEERKLMGREDLRTIRKERISTRALHEVGMSQNEIAEARKKQREEAKRLRKLSRVNSKKRGSVVGKTKG